MNALNGLDRLRAKPPLLRTAAMKTGLPTLMKSPLFLTWPGSWGLRPLRYQRALPVCVQFPNFDTIPSEEGIIHSITYWNIRLLIIIYLSKQQPLFGRTAGILNVDIFEKLRVLREKNKHFHTVSKNAASVPATPRGGKRSWDCPVTENPSLPSTPQGRGPQLWTELKALAVSTQKRRENGAQVGKIIFPLVLLSSYDAKMSSFPSGPKILNILSLAQHAGCSHNHPYFNTKIKHCVP